MAWMRRCIVTLVTFVGSNDIFNCFLQICILQTKVIIFKILLHCHCMLCFAQMVASNWVKFIVDSNNHIFLPSRDILSLFMEDWGQRYVRIEDQWPRTTFYFLHWKNPPKPLCSFVRVVPTPCFMVMVMVMNSYLVQGRVQERDHYGLYGLLPNLGGDKDKIRNGHKHFLLLSSLPLSSSSW